MTFEDINEWRIKTFAIGKDGGHEFGGIMELQPGRLIGLDAVSGAVGLAKGIAFEA